MNDPLKEISKALKKLNKMIIWLAMHTLSVKDYMEFADEFNEETNKKDIIKEWRNNNDRERTD